MKRSEHLFQFTGERIGQAADLECSYHCERMAWWKKEQDVAITKARSAGVEVREYDGTGGKSVQVVLDPTLSSRLSECASKINSHRAAADRFQIEAACYSTQADRMYELHPDDVVYFRLAGGPRDT
jgi:hypothetical protein